MKILLRWVLVLPIAILACGVVMTMIALLSVFCAGWFILGWPPLAQILGCVAGSSVFIICGATIAPNHNKIVAKTLAAILVVLIIILNFEVAFQIWNVACLVATILTCVIICFGYQFHPSSIPVSSHRQYETSSKGSALDEIIAETESANKKDIVDLAAQIKDLQEQLRVTHDKPIGEKLP